MNDFLVFYDTLSNAFERLSVARTIGKAGRLWFKPAVIEVSRVMSAVVVD